MILLDNFLIKIDYNPATDIAIIDYPDLFDFELPEVQHAIELLAETINNYNVKKILIKPTRTTPERSLEEGGEIAAFLATKLRQAHVKKMARVRSPYSAVEANARKSVQLVETSRALPTQVRFFRAKSDAMEWLMSDN
jgi:hypothetical protein